MKNNYLKLLTLALTVFAVFGMQSCESDPCSTISCSDNGVCFDGSCLCDTGWTGADCSIPDTADPCDGVTCSGNGTCISGSCECATGWTGVDCSTPVNTDPCDGVTCSGNGTCVNGDCNCDTGYTGTDCSGLTRDLMVGTWNVSESCNNPASTDTYMSNITIDAGDPLRFLIDNLYNFGSQSGINPGDATVIATVTGQNTSTVTFVVPSQTFNSNALSNFSISTTTGTYEISSDRITLNFTLTDNTSGGTDTCSQTYSR